jgi:raffinose/stachyose/melibiose transport system permease protein
MGIIIKKRKGILIWSKLCKTIPKWLLLILVTLSTILPLMFMLSLSLQSFKEALDSPIIPKNISLENYIAALQTPGFLNLFKNSIIVTSISTIIAVFISALAGYAFGRAQFPLKNVIYYSLLLGMALPVQVTLIPLFQLLKSYRLLNTYFALILPYVGFGIPFGIYIMTTFFKALPKELEEAAMIDGCNRFQMFYKVMLPLTAPAIATITIFLSLYYWNEFAFAVTFITKSELRTVPLGLRDLATQWYINYSRQAAMLTIAAVPIVIVYLSFQRQFVKGLTAGAVKG